MIFIVVIIIHTWPKYWIHSILSIIFSLKEFNREGKWPMIGTSDIRLVFRKRIWSGKLSDFMIVLDQQLHPSHVHLVSWRCVYDRPCMFSLTFPSSDLKRVSASTFFHSEARFCLVFSLFQMETTVSIQRCRALSRCPWCTPNHPNNAWPLPEEIYIIAGLFPFLQELQNKSYVFFPARVQWFSVT